MELKSDSCIWVMFVQLVLIIPYGIEIKNKEIWILSMNVLIIPYGIEMKYRFILAVTLMGFNHTLWN